MAHTQVLGGADLFLQGFSAPAAELPSWRANDAAVIVVPGNRYPLAVGMMECDVGQAKASGMKVRGWCELSTLCGLWWTPDAQGKISMSRLVTVVPGD